jgi:biotin carboxyl carrier protein
MEMAHPLDGERLAVPERMIVAPTVGVFRPRPNAADGCRVDRGETIGCIEGPGTSVEVRSPFDGDLVGVLARPGERLREGQPIAWLRVA